MKLKYSLIIILSVFSIAMLSSRIDGYMEKYISQNNPGGSYESGLYRMIGEFRDYLSYAAFLNADIYYHGGVHGMKDDPDDEDFGHIENHFEQDSPVKKTGNFLIDIADRAVITDHKHLNPAEDPELIPWLYYSVRLDPKNELAYVMCGYWLADRLNKSDDAINILREGIRNNPDSWKIPQQLGEIYLLKKKDYAAAAEALAMARDNMSREKEPVPVLDRKGLYILLADAYAKAGSPEKALAIVEELRGYLPDDPYLPEKAEYYRALIK